ncbi:MAG: class I tRNA ligase family protein, partial [bacterium]|nr:class I tRNA ligase family protein [bacterium]
MLSLYNTLSRKKEAFKPIKKTAVTFYACGPTVYDRVHIGNLRTFIFEDVLRRTLKYNGYSVRQVMNITDIEDKIIKRLKREKKRKVEEITRPYSKLFFEDIKKLNIEKAESYPLVTKNISEIIKLIQRLLVKKIAYKSKDGSTYFDISKSRKYGRLTRLKKIALSSGARVSTDEYEKGEAGDFVLWKAKKPGEPF